MRRTLVGKNAMPKTVAGPTPKQLCGRRGDLVKSLAQLAATIAVELVGPGLGKLLGQRVTLLPCFVRFFQVAFNPVQRAVGPPVIPIEANRLLRFHPRPPLASGPCIAQEVSAAKDKLHAQFGWNIPGASMIDWLGLSEHFPSLRKLVLI